MADRSTLRTKVVKAAPGAATLYPAAVAGSLLPAQLHQRSKELPAEELRLEDVTVPSSKLAAYARVCGFTLTDELPATLPEVIGFPLQMALFTGWAFPVPAMGLVHTTNVITQHRPIGAGEPFALGVRAEALRQHPRGSEFDVVTTATVDGGQVWEARATYLARGPKLGAPRADSAGPRTMRAGEATLDETAPPTATWRLSGDLGRQYAAVSGDRNPIHMHPLTAKLFGFPKAIAHGMWTAARVLSALEGRLPDAFSYEARFRAPVLLPAKVAFRASEVPGGWDATLTDARSERLHLAGTFRAL